MVWNGSAFSRVQVIAEHDSGVADMRERPASRNNQTPRTSAAVSERIDQAQRDRASQLDLSAQGLTALPEAIGQLTRLPRLDLSRNPLTVIADAIGQLTQLQELNLSLNQLRALPEAIGQLTRLQKLVLASNELIACPEAIGQLVRLQELNLSRNQLTALPEAIGQLTRLPRLDLSGNQLTALPQAIGQLTRLEELNLTNNRLTALPDAIRRNLSILRQLYLHGNDALSLPAEVLGPPRTSTFGLDHLPAKPSDILDYYVRVRAGWRPLNEAKLILVGRGAVGKTSIVNRLVDDAFHPDEKKTDGIRITEWPLQINENDQVRLNIWDFGGQEIMHATHQFFLTQRSLYLLVLNGREGGEDADADYWLKLIDSFGAESPVIVVMNKIKAHPFDLNRRGLQQKYPAIREFIKTDCEDGAGVGQLRKAIERETDRLEHLRDAFPTSWFTIKDQLAGMEKNYLSFDEYREVCARLGEIDAAAQDALAVYLHSLGIALNYKDDPRLQDTHVLNPHWVTNGIYKILNSEKLEAQRGEIRLRELAGVLDSGAYPARMCPFLFDLMKKFELCFTFPDDDTHYLIPELLDKQEPPETAQFTPEDCLNFQY
jgi:internalin A